MTTSANPDITQDSIQPPAAEVAVPSPVSAESVASTGKPASSTDMQPDAPGPVADLNPFRVGPATDAGAGSSEPEAHAEPEQDESVDQPKRPLTVRDRYIAGMAGLGYMTATMLAGAYHDVNIEILVLLGIVGLGMGVLAWFDHATHLILNKHNLVFGGIAAVAIAAASVIAGSWMMAVMAVIAAAVSFIFMLALAVMRTGMVGGGDIKLSPTPAALLAAYNPLAALLWLLFSFILCLGSAILVKVSGKSAQPRAMAPFMALALIPAVLGTGAMLSAAGI